MAILEQFEVISDAGEKIEILETDDQHEGPLPGNKKPRSYHTSAGERVSLLVEGVYLILHEAGVIRARRLPE